MLEVKNLSVIFNKNTILKNLNFKVNKGDILSVIGPNGSGKSTLLKALSGNLKNYNGSIFLNKKNIKNFKPKDFAKVISYLSQSVTNIPNFTVKELVELGIIPSIDWKFLFRKKDYDSIDKILKQFELYSLKERSLHTLSGGELQRAFIAMVFAQNTNIMLFDEPTTYLDLSHQYWVLNILKNLNRLNGKTIILVLHDLNQALAFSNKVLLLDKNAGYYYGTPEDVINRNSLNKVFNLKADIIDYKRRKIIIPNGLVNF